MSNSSLLTPTPTNLTPFPSTHAFLNKSFAEEKITESWLVGWLIQRELACNRIEIWPADFQSDSSPRQTFFS